MLLFFLIIIDDLMVLLFEQQNTVACQMIFLIYHLPIFQTDASFLELTFFHCEGQIPPLKMQECCRKWVIL